MGVGLEALDYYDVRMGGCLLFDLGRGGEGEALGGLQVKASVACPLILEIMIQQLVSITGNNIGIRFNR